MIIFYFCVQVRWNVKNRRKNKSFFFFFTMWTTEMKEKLFVCMEKSLLKLKHLQNTDAYQ